MTALRIVGGRALLPGEGLRPADVHVEDGRVVPRAAGGRALDARGLLVLPGVVDVHGDAFERQLQPRPGVGFPAPVALADTERQLLANGVTTAFHAVTLSWEPGLRGIAAWDAWLDALDARRPRAGCDMRVQMRWEACNLDALDRAVRDIEAGRVGMVALNDHTPAILRRLGDPAALAKYTERAGVGAAEFRALAEAAGRRASEAPAGIVRLLRAARRLGLPVASHDDATVAARDAARAAGARTCEFPMAEAVGLAARAAGDHVVMGAPNALRGGSHLGWASAAAMAGAGICDVLCSDYFYPALSRVPFALAARGVLDFPSAWALVSANPAAAAGLRDRGVIAEGRRADLVLVAEDGTAPVATIAAGRVAFLSAEGASRLG